MSFKWSEHTECLAARLPGHLPRGTGPCEADRAEMIAEGERLVKMLDVCSAVHAHNVKLKAENARLLGLLDHPSLRQLFGVIEDSGPYSGAGVLWTHVREFLDARAALEGVNP